MYSPWENVESAFIENSKKMGNTKIPSQRNPPIRMIGRVYNILFISKINYYVEKDTKYKGQHLFVKGFAFQYLCPAQAVSIAKEKITTEEERKKKVIFIKKVRGKKEGCCPPEVARLSCFCIFNK